MFLDDRTAEDGAELVVPVRRLAQPRLLVECLPAIERAISEILVARSVKRVRTRPRHDVEYRGAAASVLGRRGVGLDAIRVNRGLAELIRIPGGTVASDWFACDAARVIEAIDDEPVLRAWQLHHADAACRRIRADRRRQFREPEVLLRPGTGRSRISASATNALACVRADSAMGGYGLSAMVSGIAARRSGSTICIRCPGRRTMSSWRRPAKPS